MLPQGASVQFDERRFLAPTYEGLVEAVVKLVEKAIISPEEARVMLAMPSQQAAETLAQLMVPPSAGASPAQSYNVAQLRPTGTS
jgi:hypothetical protein